MMDEKRGPEESGGYSLITLCFAAPLIGIRKRWPNVLHAVEMEGLPIKTWPNGLATSVCGKTGLRILENALWPPYVDGLGEMERCRECFAKCKKKRPRCRFVRREEVA